MIKPQFKGWRRGLVVAVILLLSIMAISLGSIGNASDTEQKMSIEQIYYSSGEDVFIHILEPVESKELFIVYGDKVYRYAGDVRTLTVFTPKRLGNYTVKLLDREDGSITSYNFMVVNLSADKDPDNESTNIVLNQSNVTNGIISISKVRYSLGEGVKISVSDDVAGLELQIGDSSLQYLGNFGSAIVFIPKQLGEHRIIATLKNGSIVERSFFVQPLQPAEPFKQIKDLLKLDTGGNVEDYGFQVIKQSNGLVDLQLYLESGDKVVESILFKGLEFGTNVNTLRIEKVNKVIPELKFKRPQKVFAIDPTELNFINATVTSVAVGTELYKCKEWNFGTQVCLGSWEKIMDIVPGQEYSFILTPNDPGYAETGVASINTRRSIYHPGETAEIVIVVLDIEGHLVSGASVVLNITDPNNNLYTYSTAGLDIIETQKGIYETDFSSTSLEGNYSMAVKVIGNKVDSYMYSYFVVKDFYEFDILRQIPVTTNPWKGPFESIIRILSNNYSGLFNFTEVLPSTFELSDYGNAIKTGENDSVMLTWENLANNSQVSYMALPPLVTPDLYEIGPGYVTYGNFTYIETRPWFLAIDPAAESRPTDFTDPDSFGTSEASAYDNNFGSSASIDIDDSGSAQYVTYISFNITGLNPAGTLNGLNITFTVATTGTFAASQPDNWYLEFYNGSWITCYSSEASFSKDNITCDVGYGSWTVQDFADNFQVRVGGDKDGGADTVSLLVYEIWANLDYTLPNIVPALLSWARNQTSVYVNDTIMFNSTWNDTDGTLDSWIFAWNLSDSWSNVTYRKFVSAIADFYAATGSYGGNWTNSPEEADGAPDNSVAWDDTDNDRALYTFNFSGLYGAGSVNNAYLGLRANFSYPAIGNDELTLKYSLDNVTWYNLDGTAYDGSSTANQSGTLRNYYYPITASLDWTDLDNIYLGVEGKQVGLPDDEIVGVDAIWLRVDYTSLAESNQTVDAPAGKVIGWRFYANDTEGGINAMPIQSFTVLGVDNVPPSIANESITPSQAVSGTQFNITADVTDDITVQGVWAEILMPNGSISNESMQIVSGNRYKYDYLSQSGGNFSFIVYAFDGTNYNVSETRQYFNVTASISTPNTYYARGDAVLISGNGFYAGGLVDIDIRHKGNGSSITNYPVTISADENGSISRTWNIPSELTFAVGNFTIQANDTTISWLNDQTEIGVVIKPSAVFRHSDDGGPGYWDDYPMAEVNDSDNWYANIVGAPNEVFLETNFSNVLPIGYEVTSAYLYWEHFELSADSTYVKWYNSSSGIFQTICTVGNRVTKGFDSCNLSGVITDSSGVNDLTLRISDDDGATNNVNWTMIDFVYLDIEFTISLDMSITITEPSLDVSKYNYIDSKSKAYDGADPVNAPPPSSILTGSEASAEEYTNLNESDNEKFHTLVAGAGYHAYQTFKFIVTDSESDINSITLVHEGYATEKVAQDPDNYYIFMWNYSAGAFEQLVLASPSASDQTVTITVSGNASDFINGSGGEVWVMVEGHFRTGGSDNAQADLYTDFIELRVNKIPTLTGQQDINATVTDGDGVAACDYFYTYPNGTLASQIIGMQNYSYNIWLNVSNTQLYTDGLYYLYINCTDNPGGTRDNSSIYVRIANTPPSIKLVFPPNLANLTYLNINFTWNVTEMGSGIPSCNLSIDSVVRQQDISSTSGANTTRNSTVTDGIHYWNVTCKDSAGLSNTSETWQIDVDTTPPSINLNSPNQSYATNLSIINFSYTPVDAHAILNCSLIIGGNINDTNYTISNSLINNFTVSNFNQGLYQWSINCTDSFGIEGNSATRDFSVDWTKPNIQLDYPEERASLSGGTVVFNFTVYDNLDSNLTCNLTIDDSVSATNNNFGALGNNVTNVTESGLGDGDHNWSITCWDDAININSSDTRNFSISGPPVVNLLLPVDGGWSNETIVNFTFYVNDANGIANCSFYFDGNYNDTINGSDITNPGNNSYNLSNIAEGLHNWTVNCTDGTGASTMPSVFNFTADRTKPNIGLFRPSEGENVINTTVKFNFTVLDHLDSTLICNFTIDGNVSETNNNFAAYNNSLTNVTETDLSDGNHTWSVTCWDNATNINTSTTINFTVDGPPTANLYSPPSGAQRQENITLIYYVSDDSGLINCTLIFDGAENDSTPAASITNPGYNNFTLYNVSTGLHNWTINCTDIGYRTAQPSEFNITIDMGLPIVNAHYPDGDTFSTNSIAFNISIVDDYSQTLTCNVSVDGGNYSNTTTAISDTYSYVNISGIQDGFHFWNVSCYDEANNTGYSSTLNFSIDAAPQVFLDKPEDNYGDTEGNVTFTYEVYEDSLANCSLIINNKINQTNTSSEIPHIGDDKVNNFTLTNMAQGVYNWTVNCTDTNGFTGTYPVRILHIDWVYPWVTLSEPKNDTNISYSTVEFNFSAYDAVDPILACNLSVIGPVNTSKLLNATANVPTLTNISGFVSGNYTWNVSCNDNSNQENYSDSWIFHIISTPVVELQTPTNGSTENNGDVLFWYIPQDLEGLSYCNIDLDGVYNDTKVTGDGGVKNGEPSNFTINKIAEGNHTWLINCSDTDFNKGLSSLWIFFVDLTDPNINLNYPDGHTINVSYVNFNWTAYDNMDSNLSCNLTVGDSTYADINSPNATPTNYSIAGFNDSLYYWNITCVDNGGRINVSSMYNFTIAEPPKVALNLPPNNHRNNTLNMTVYYTPTDNSGAVQNCTLILNGANNQTNRSISHGDMNNFTVYNLINGTYTWDVNCTDPNGNSDVNGTPMTFYIDLTPPIINLTRPAKGQVFNLNNITFNWTATDFAGTYVTCNLSASDDSGEKNVTGITLLSGSMFNASIINMSEGIHYWNVTCFDDLGNWNISDNWNFTVNQPDLYISNSRLSFNYTNPDLNENITIYANVTNIGGIDASNVFVEFWDGLPGSGKYIGNDTNNVAVGANVTFSVTWLITGGYHNIWVVVDPDNEISELLETNNNATINISVLISTINRPFNDSWSSNETVEINFTLQDFTEGTINYSIYVDGSLNGQTGGVNDNQSFLLNVTFTEGVHTVMVQANDTLGRLKNSTPLTLNIDLTDPYPVFETLNDTWYNDTTPEVSFNITDNMDTMLNYTLYVNGSSETTGNVSNGTTVNYNLSSRPDGIYLLELEAFDESGRIVNSTPIIIYIDTTKPSINLTYPVNGFNTTQRSIELNFSVDDNLDKELICNLTFDNNVIREGIAASRNIKINTTVFGLNESTYYWNVTCQDNATNWNVSKTYSFSVYLPPEIDLIAPQHNTWNNSQNITFFFNVTDTTGLANCSLILNNNINDTKTTAELNNRGVNNITVTNIDSGYYNWSINCTDNTPLNVEGNSTTRFIKVDNILPTINLTYPPFGLNYTNTTIDLNFTVVDNIDDLLVCNLTLNDNVIRSGFNASNNTEINTTVFGLNETTYYWNVSCIDNASNINISENYHFFVWIAPNITALSPDDYNWTGKENQTFFFNVSDSTGIENCSIWINGQINDTKPNDEILNNARNNFTVNYLNGTYVWAIECYDNTSQYMYSVTQNRTLYVDIVAPYPQIETLNGTWFNTTTPLIDFNITDNLDTRINYTFYVDGVANKVGSTDNFTSNSTNLVGLSEGAHVIILEAVDNVGNILNSSNITIFIDVTKPSINLTYPNDEYNSSLDYLDLNFTVTDNLDINLSCNLTIDGSVYSPGINASNNTEIRTFVTDQTPGTHYWNVTCWDNAGNINTSETRSFLIEAPDLTLNATHIQFNDSFFYESQNITINATIFNIGNGDAFNVTVQFWNGDWENGTQINGNRTITELLSGANQIVNITYITRMGPTKIYVVIDPPLETNGAIEEAIETNNFAFNNITVGSYEIVTGNITGLLQLIDTDNMSLINWNLTNYTDSNIYAADSDSSIKWSMLLAISRNTTGTLQMDDFDEIDVAMNMISYNDSINTTWTVNNNLKDSYNWTIYGDTISYVPIMNSTNTSNFFTGILWDYNDQNNGEFNGTQDLVFVTKVNENKQGQYGIYDFEMKVPARLREYLQPNSMNSVTFYAELK